MSHQQLAEQYLHQDPGGLMADHGKSFHFASMIFTKERFLQIAKLYKVCRYIDDAADELEPKEAQKALAEIKAVLDPSESLTQSRGAQEGVFAKMVAELETYGVTKPQLLELVAGAQFDADGGEILTDGDLILYSYRVAGVVGLMMCPLLGVKDSAGHRHAIDLGVAMQLTNICRDVLEDAKMQRVYLARQRWQAAGLTMEQLAEHGATPNALKAIVADTLALAERYYRSGYAGLSYIPFRPRLCILLAGEIYRHIGLKLLALECPVLQGRVFVPWPQKLWITLKTLPKLLRPNFWRPSPHDGSLHLAIADKPGATAAAQSAAAKKAPPPIEPISHD